MTDRITWLRVLAAGTQLMLSVVAFIVLDTFLRSLWKSQVRWTDVLALGPVFLALLTLAVWFGVVGWRTWHASPGWSRALWRTNLVTLLVGALLLWTGTAENRAAARSAAHGGGLLGGLGDVATWAGLALVIIAVVALVAARVENRAGRAPPDRPE